ncbi:MAG: DUF2723 domain-containing protein [Calditrichaceae bacterium]|nr:DUF2723 domain-containing protein [Calditrichaceae bacterium]
MEKLNRIVAGVIFVFTGIIYLLTMAPTVSFWDCGEFIACSYRMAVPHPPGAPFFLLLGRIFSLLPIPGDVAFKVNLISAISSALTIMLLYLSIIHIYREWKGEIKDRADWLNAIFSGVIGSLAFAFTHSFWFNAVEAEVYALSMLFTALIVWLILVWAEKADQPGNERYLLMIAYIIGLAIAVHLLNVLALPFVAMIFYYKKYEYNLKSFAIMTAITVAVMIAIYPGIVKWMPLLALKFGFMGLFLLFIIIIGLSLWAINNHRHVLSLVFVSVLLIMLGYASYGTIYIRSNLNPTIDENNPETLENFIKYINREQYGEHSITDREGVWKSSPNGRQYKSTAEFFWKYQVHRMYNRYFAWQFVGMHENEEDWSIGQLFALPLILGLVGLFWHSSRDNKRFLSVLALFFLTGLAIILYLNQPDPQPRERDYSYVGSFFAFSIWIGLGYAAIIDWLKTYYEKKNEVLSSVVMYSVFVVLLLAVPGLMLAKNYHSHDRTGNYVAWDYSYNMLMSCEENGILFTNGDNDTFPLWYLQEVENIRKDVRIVNLSLLNTDWYIRQLRDLEPRVPMKINEGVLERLGLFPWQSTEVSVKVPSDFGQKKLSEFQNEYTMLSAEVPEEIKFKVEPTYNTRMGGAIRTQDYMVLNIVTANQWRRPIYFAVTVPQSNMLSEFAEYFRMDGLVLKLVPFKDWEISPTKLYNNLMDVYQYRGLDDPDVYYNSNIKNLLQNYRTAFIRLAEYYTVREDNLRLLEVLKKMDEKVDPKVIPWTSGAMRSVRDAFHINADTSAIKEILESDRHPRDLQYLGEHLLRLRKVEPAIRVLENAYQKNPKDKRALGLLINSYQMAGQPERAIAPLESWLYFYPNDTEIQNYLNRLKRDTSRSN